MQLTGIHHLTAVSADAPGNVAFYTRMLGMRLVKKTVNQDDVSAYHFFYADGKASPGSDITFFDFPTRPGRHGNNSLSRTGLRVAGAATLEWWHRRLKDGGIRTGEIAERDGRLTLDFEDAEGQRLSLIDDGGKGEAYPWEKSPVPTEHQIRGLGPIIMTVPALESTEAVLIHAMNMRRVRGYRDPESPEEDVIHVFEMGDGGPAAELHVAVRPSLPRAHPGAGSVHHVAFRVDDDAYDAWAQRLNTLRIPNSGKVDRFYFRSLYFREPNGILFEIATDGPGFATDEPMDKLGEKLALPPFLEPRRKEIEAGLKPV